MDFSEYSQYNWSNSLCKKGFYKLHAILIEINYRRILLNCILVAITTVQVEMCKSLLYVRELCMEKNQF